MAEQWRMTVGARGSRGRLTSNAVKFYNTSYRASYDPGSVNFPAYLRHSHETGFTVNRRAAVYDRPSLQHLNNLQFGERGVHQLSCHPETGTAKEESLQTEYQRSFVPHPLTLTVSQYHMTVGPKQESVFTKVEDLQPITFEERKRCTVRPPQTYSSVTKSDFRPPPLFLQGTEARPGLCSRSSRETGFTRGTVAPLASPTSYLPSPHTRSNATAEKTIGEKEPTGALVDAPNPDQALPNTPFNCSCFTSHYQSTFCHPADHEKLNSGHSCAGIISAKMDSSDTRQHRQVHF